MSNIKKVVGVINSKKDEKDDNAGTCGEDHTRIAQIVKPAKIPTWTKSLSLETYIKQIETWSQINKDVPENTKYQDLAESLKVNKSVKNVSKFVREHVLPILIYAADKTTKRVLDILKIKH